MRGTGSAVCVGVLLHGPYQLEAWTKKINKKGKCSSPYVNQSLHIMREMVSQNGVAMRVSESIPDFSEWQERGQDPDKAH